MTDGFEEIVRQHRSATAVHQRFATSGGDALAHEHCLLVDQYLSAEEVALLPRVRDLPGGEALATELEAQGAAVRHLVARVFESPPDDLTPLVDAVDQEARTYETLVEDGALPLLREHGVDASALGASLHDARERASDVGPAR